MHYHFYNNTPRKCIDFMRRHFVKQIIDYKQIKTYNSNIILNTKSSIYDKEIDIELFIKNEHY